MGTDHSGVNDQVFHIRVVNEMVMHPFPDTLLAPAHKPLVDTVPFAVFTWQPPPLGPATSYQKDGFDKNTAFGLLSNIDIWALIKELVNL